MVDTAQAQFPDLMERLVLKPAGMSNSTFAQPLPGERESQAVMGHLADGKEVPGGWHVFREHAAAGLWSTPTDLANLLLAISRSWRGASRLFLLPETAREMLTRKMAALMGWAGQSSPRTARPILMIGARIPATRSI